MAIVLGSINKSFGKQSILKDFSLTLEDSGITCFLGPSGSGKTTLFNLIAGLIDKDSGRISGLSSSSRVSFVFQEERLMPWLSSEQNIRAVMDLQSGKTPLDFLKMVNLEEEDAVKLPSELSGGMQRRVSIARALAFDGELMLLDEPFNGLDGVLKNKIMELIYRYSRKKPVLMITHTQEEALYLADRILIMNGPPLNIIKDFKIDAPYEERMDKLGSLKQQMSEKDRQ